jgi:hypothetical protein
MPDRATESPSLSSRDSARDDARTVLGDQAQLLPEDVRTALSAKFDLGAVDIFPASPTPGQPIALAAGMGMIPIGTGGGLALGFVPGLGPSGPVSPPPLSGVRGWGFTTPSDELGPAATDAAGAAETGGEVAEGAEIGTQMAQAVSQGAQALETGAPMVEDMAAGLATAPAEIVEVTTGVGVVQETGGTVLVLIATPGAGWAILGIVVGTVIVAGVAYLVYRQYQGSGTVPRSLPGAASSGPLVAPGAVSHGPLMLPSAPSIQPMRLPGEPAPPVTLPGQYETVEPYQLARRESWPERISQEDLDEMLDDPGTGFERLKDPAGQPISEPGFRGRRSLGIGRRDATPGQRKGATFPDAYGTWTATGKVEAMELKTIPRGDSVAIYFRRWAVSIIDEHSGRVRNLPARVRTTLVVDIRQCGQTKGEAMNDLSDVLRNYGRMGDARRTMWAGVRFIEGSYDQPTLSPAYRIP